VCSNQLLPRRLLFGKTHNHGWKSHLSAYGSGVRFEFPESRTLGRVRKFGGKFHRKLNISSSPIANKYHEGKVKSTLKRELNVPEIVVNQAIGINVVKELERNLVSLDPLKTAVTFLLVAYTAWWNPSGVIFRK
jgi:hypothetical protein